MSLTGNLEDLPLLDIIQIVSFSKKTGYLTIRTDHGEAAIVFQAGTVVASFTWDSLPLDPRAAALPAQKRHALLRNRIEIALEQLIRLREGQFNFNLTDEPPERVGSRDVGPETLTPGINPQELLLDLARGMDEDRRDSTAAIEASFAQPPEEEEATESDAREVASFLKDVRPGAAPAQETPGSSTIPIVPVPEAAAPPAGAEELRAILLVDDEDDVRRVLSERFVGGGYQVVEAEDPDSAVKKAGRLGKAGIPFLLVTDLGMPTSGGASFQGGFEVVKRLWRMKLRPPVLLMTESLNGALRARAKQMGIGSVVFKPGLSKLDPKQFEADLRAFASRIHDDILPRLAHRQAAPVRPKPGLAGGAPREALPEPGADELSRQFDSLRRRLDELQRPGDATQISLLVMKVAREFFERGILFLVKNEEVRGLGGFGPAPKDESINLVVREVVIPLSEPSSFLQVVSKRKPFTGALDGKWGSYLLGKIGAFRSNGVALLPMLAHREPIAVLFGDNPETGRDFGRLDVLEVFVNQAGIALENAFLQRKIETMQRAEP